MNFWFKFRLLTEINQILGKSGEIQTRRSPASHEKLFSNRILPFHMALRAGAGISQYITEGPE
jgi:hypothetical protein